MDRVRVYTDGGARGNPGPAAIGIVLCDDADRLLEEHKECIGIATNNEAEYRALIKGLSMAVRHTRDHASCILDSELVVRQLSGRYRVKDERMFELRRQVRDAEQSFTKVTYGHRPRLTGLLRRADELVNEALDEASKDHRQSGSKK